MMCPNAALLVPLGFVLGIAFHGATILTLRLL